MNAHGHRYLFRACALAFVLWLILATRSAASSPPFPPDGGTSVPPAPSSPGTDTVSADYPPALAGTPVHDLAVAALRAKLKHRTRQLAAARARVRGLTRTLAHRTSTREAIALACSVYGNCALLYRRADCESGFYAFARNPYSDASGLYQFMPSTWNTTPFGRFSIWSPYAQAMAAGWMQAHGRGGEWVCR